MKEKKKLSFSPVMMVFKYIIGLVVGSIVVTGVGFIDSVLWKVAIFVASTLASTIVGALYSAEILKTKKATSEFRIIIFTFLLFFAYLIINVIGNFAGTMPTWAFIVVFILFVLIVGSLAIFIYFKYKKHSELLYYSRLDYEKEEQELKRIEEEKRRDERLGRNGVVDLTKFNKK